MTALFRDHYPFQNDLLPAGWCEVPFGQIALELQSGFSCGQHNKDGIGIPHLRPMNVTADGRVTLDDVLFIDPSAGDLRLSDGEILFTNTSSTVWVGKTGVVRKPGDWGFSNHMTRIRLKSGLLPDFFAKQLHFLCRSGYFAHHCTEHINQSSISPSTLRTKIPIRVPPANEQKRIVERLIELETQQEAARKRLFEIPSQLYQSRQALFASAFSGALTDDSRGRRAGQPPIALRKLGDLVEFVTSGSRGWAAYYATAGAHFIRSQDISTDAMIWDDVAHVRPPKGAEGSRTRVRRGDVLITITGGNVGRTAWIDRAPREAYVSQHLALLRPKPELSSEYLHLWLLSDSGGRNALKQSATGQGRPGIGLATIRNLKLPVPPIEEQTEVVKRLKSALAKIEIAEASHQSALSELERVEQAVLARAFRGELTHQSPSDESASAMLEHAATQPSPMSKKKEKSKSISPTEVVRAAIASLPGNTFTFEQLRAKTGANYETLRSEIFALLEGPAPAITQEFDKASRQLRFKRTRP
jgi:type I restriction enzyme S subunit